MIRFWVRYGGKVNRNICSHATYNSRTVEERMKHSERTCLVLLGTDEA